MRPGDGRHEIVETHVEGGSARPVGLARRFAVSKMTIRRDHNDLEGEGRLRKIRGGAAIEAGGWFEGDLRFRARMAAEGKRRIARPTAAFIEPGTIVMIDDGSTSQAMVPFPIERRPLTVIADDLAVFAALAGQAGIGPIALGGTLSRKIERFFGVPTENAPTGLRADAALPPSSAISGRTTIHQDQEVLETQRGMIGAAARRRLMVDHGTFGRTALHLPADLDVLDGVVTTRSMVHEKAEAPRRDGIALRLAEGE